MIMHVCVTVSFYINICCLFCFVLHCLGLLLLSCSVSMKSYALTHHNKELSDPAFALVQRS